MNNDKKQIDEQFLPRHSQYIRNMSEKTGRTYRELEAEWKKAERQFDFDRMRDPLKYQNLKRNNGTVAQEISRRFEEMVIMPTQPEEVEEQIDNIEADMVEDEFATDIEENFTDDIEGITDEDILGDIEIDNIDGEQIEDDFSIEEESEEGLDEEIEDTPSEGIPNKSLEQQREIEREEPATTAGEVNKKEP